MADKKISALTAASTPLAGTEVLPIVQSNTTKKVSVADLTSGRAISATAITATDNFVVGTAGKGIDFSANTSAPGATSELLDWYEEGVFTPTLGGNATYFLQNGKYTRIGNVVHFSVAVIVDQIGSGSTYEISGLPFSAAASTEQGATVIYYNNLASNIVNLAVFISGTTATVLSATAASGSLATNALYGNFADLRISGTYFT